MNKKKWLLVGIGLLALGLAVGLVPWSESYSDYGAWSNEGAVDVKCGSLIARDVRADFADWQEQQSYDRERSWYGEPAIFEGQTATQVCQHKLSGTKTGVMALIVGGVIALIVGVTRKPPVWNEATVVASAVAAPHTRNAAWPAPALPEALRAFATEPAATPVAEYTSDSNVSRDVRPAVGSVESTPHHVVFDNGEVAELGSTLVIGRDPAAFDGVPGARLHALADQTRTVSKTHLALIPEGNLVWVVDRDSTNGTALVHDGKELRIQPGVRAPALPGQTIKFGDRTLTIMGQGM